ncbi:hypothetical protein QUF75_20525 [Desulfococcaceae bacterium HSG7]|nr:hypothetical protein [Desulfococcaceae bacterium HSG7]
MKEVTIYSSASCNWNTREGRFFAALEYQGHYKYITGIQTDTTADRCILTGFLQAVHLINEPCDLKLVTATRISFDLIGNPKGRNKELKQLLLDIMKEKQCRFEIDEWTGGGKHLKLKLSKIIKVALKAEPIDVITHYGVDDSD